MVFISRSFWEKRVRIKQVFLSFVFCSGMIASNLGLSQPLTYQDWRIQGGTNSVEAFTTNGPNSSFGLYCSGEQCLFYLHDALRCQPGSSSPVLLSSIGKTAALTMRCTLIGGTLFQILEPFATVFESVKAGGVVGFAVPLQSGSFGVSQYSLQGSSEAIQKTLSEARKPKPAQPIPPNNPREEVSPRVVPGAQKLKEIMIWVFFVNCCSIA